MVNGGKKGPENGRNERPTETGEDVRQAMARNLQAGGHRFDPVRAISAAVSGGKCARPPSRRPAPPLSYAGRSARNGADFQRNPANRGSSAVFLGTYVTKVLLTSHEPRRGT